MTVEHFMGVDYQEINFDNGNVVLIGGNGAGKSSLIRALLSPIDSKWIPDKPIKAGEERGSIILKIDGTRNGQKEEYEIQCVFTPSNQRGKISIIRNGEKVKGGEKTILNQIFGRIGFSITDFFNASEKERLQMLKEVSKCGDKIDKLDHQRAEAEVVRKVAKAELEKMKNVNSREARPFTDEDIDKYRKKEDEEALQVELKEVSSRIDKYNENYQKIETARRQMDEAAKRADEIGAEITRLNEELDAKKAQMIEKTSFVASKQKWLKEQAEPWLERNKTKPSTDAVIARIADVRKHNQMVEIISQYADRQKSILSKQEEVEELEERIKAIDKQKIDVIASSQLPVDGLLWGEDGVTLNGIPVEQVNTQKQLDLAIAIATAMNPTLKLVVISEGSLFDSTHLKSTLDTLTQRGFYWVVEKVAQDGTPLEIKYEERDV